MQNHDAHFAADDYAHDLAAHRAAFPLCLCGLEVETAYARHCRSCAACLARDAAREVTFWAAFTIVRLALARVNAGIVPMRRAS